MLVKTGLFPVLSFLVFALTVKPTQADPLDPPATDNLKFQGELVMDPCELDPESTEITVDFGTIVDKYLYLNERTFSQLFTIKLVNCEPDDGDKVIVTFKGTESTELDGYIVPTSGGATGIAIGMESLVADSNGYRSLLPFNEPLAPFEFRKEEVGTIGFLFRAFVQGEPSAIASHSIGLGAFNAVSTFEIDYP